MFVICGEALWDLFAVESAEGLSFDARIGGSPFNVAVALARLGQAAALFTGVSSDRLGDRLVAALRQNGVATGLLAIAENHISHSETAIIDLMFETMSAMATVGLSTGITPALSIAGKLVLCAAMFVGRLGPLTAVYALQRHEAPARYRFPEEAVRIG